MPLQDFTNPEYIKFFTESCEKELKLRMKWNNYHGSQLSKAAEFIGGEKGHDDQSITLSVLKEGMKALTRSQKSDAVNKLKLVPHDTPPKPLLADMKKEHTIPKIGLGDPKDDPRLARPDSDLTPDPIMRPVPPAHNEILYKCSELGCGKKEYLKIRHRLSPEEKYYFAESVSWDLGWRIKDSYFGRQAPMYPRVRTLTREGMSRSGPAPDPSYYMQLTKGGKHVCSL